MAPSHTPAHSEGTPSHNSDDESDYHEHELRNSSTNTRSKAAANSKKKPSASRRTSLPTTLDDSHAHEDSADPQNARKMQNRLAQREFRARRLEHIKELEARVEFLSKPQSEQTEILVAIIHGLMDENKQLRGSLKTMANFVSTGLGGFSNAIQLPKYDNALELVNRGDRALLLKLVQEKGASVGESHGSNGSTPPVTGHASSSTHKVNPSPLHASSQVKASTSPPPAGKNAASSDALDNAHGHNDKKRKTDSSSRDVTSSDASARPSAAKAPRTRSHNQRTTRQGAQQSVADGQQSPVHSPVTSKATVQVNNETQIQYPSGPQSVPTAMSQNGPAAQSGSSAGAADIFPNLVDTGRSLNTSTFDILANGASTPSVSITPNYSAFVKQEDSPPLPTYGDSASAWLNAYTNLTPIGGNESFWSLTSSAMSNQGPLPNSANNQQQQQQQQQPRYAQASDPQDGRSPSSAYLSQWGSTAAQMLSANGTISSAFASVPHQGVQPPLHGYA